jgi:hypothetical protein
LHVTRLLPSPSLPNNNNNNNNNDNVINIADMFSGSSFCLHVDNISEWSLTLLHQHSNTFPNSNSYTALLKPFDIKTFKLQLSQPQQQQQHCQRDLALPSLPQAQQQPQQPQHPPVLKGRLWNSKSHKKDLEQVLYSSVDSQLSQADVYLLVGLSLLASLTGVLLFNKRKYGILLLFFISTTVLLHIIFFHFVF